LAGVPAAVLLEFLFVVEQAASVRSWSREIVGVFGLLRGRADFLDEQRREALRGL
jgi:hypothetical protein